MVYLYYMITHEQLLAMWEEDAVIERTQLDRESLAIPKLHHKYLQILMDIRSKKVAFTHQLETLKKEKELFYKQLLKQKLYDL